MHGLDDQTGTGAQRPNRVRTRMVRVGVQAAQFLQRYVKETPWAHIDVAGTAMGSPPSDINQSWGSGWGVRLLNRLMADSYED